MMWSNPIWILKANGREGQGAFGHDKIPKKKKKKKIFLSFQHHGLIINVLFGPASKQDGQRVT